MIYELKVSAVTNPSTIVFNQTFSSPIMNMNVGDYFTFGSPGAPPSASNNGNILKIAHAVFPAPAAKDWVCSTWVLYDPKT